MPHGCDVRPAASRVGPGSAMQRQCMALPMPHIDLVLVAARPTEQTAARSRAAQHRHAPRKSPSAIGMGQIAPSLLSAQPHASRRWHVGPRTRTCRPPCAAVSSGAQGSAAHGTGSRCRVRKGPFASRGSQPRMHRRPLRRSLQPRCHTQPDACRAAAAMSDRWAQLYLQGGEASESGRITSRPGVAS